MKKCPKCSRTYADDGFTFCLEDGTLLSAPYDPNKQEPVSTIQSAGPPPTAVIPGRKMSDQEVPPTLISTPSPNIEPQVREQPAISNSQRASRVKYGVIGLVALVVVVSAVGLIGFYVAGSSNCPKLVIKCYPQHTGTAGTNCELMEGTSQTFNNIRDKPISNALSSRSAILLQAAVPEGITNVSWSASAGTVRFNHSQMTIETPGLAGETITVMAKVTSRSWLCSTTVTSSFVVPPAALK